MLPPDASACRTAICSSSLFPGFHKHIPCTSLNSSSFTLVDSLCLSDSVLVRIHPCFSSQGSLNDRSDSLSAFIVMWLCRFSVRCKRSTTQTTSSVTMSLNICGQHVESSGFTFWRAFNHNPWQWGARAFFVSCDFLCQLQFWSHHLPRSATQTFRVRRFPTITQCLSCPTFASHNAILGDAQNCSCSIMMTNADSLSHATCKRTDTVFVQFYETKLFLQIAPLAFSIFDSSPHFHSFFRLCQSSFCS